MAARHWKGKQNKEEPLTGSKQRSDSTDVCI